MLRYSNCTGGNKYWGQMHSDTLPCAHCWKWSIRFQVKTPKFFHWNIHGVPKNMGIQWQIRYRLCYALHLKEQRKTTETEAASIWIKLTLVLSLDDDIGEGGRRWQIVSIDHLRWIDVIAMEIRWWHSFLWTRKATSFFWS